MSNTHIQIKRSLTTGAPATLWQGELAWSNASQVLYVGNPDGSNTVTAIAGGRTPGTLTANQALVANSTSGINRILAANVDVSVLNANGSAGSAGWVLYSGGGTTNTYWASTGALGTNVASQYAWTNTQSFSNTITFTSTIVGTVNNALYLGGTIAASYQGTANLAAVVATLPANNTLYLGGTAAASYQQTGAPLSGNIAAYLPTYTGVVNSSSMTVGGIYGSTTGGSIANLTTMAAGNSTVNSISTYSTDILNSPTGQTSLAAGQIIVNANATSNIVVGNSTVSVTVNSTNFTGTANNSLYLGGTIASGFQGTANLAAAVALLPANSASYIGTTPAASVVNTSGNFTMGGNTIFSANVTFNGANLYVTGTNTTFTSNVVFTGANITATSSSLAVQNLNVTGGLTVGGTVSVLNTQQLVVNDNIIELGENNTTTDALDTGWYSPAGNSTAIWYSGLARVAALSTNSNPTFWLFGSNTNPNTASTIDTTSNSATGSLKAYLIPYGIGGALVVNSTAVTLTANSTLPINITANTLALSTALTAVNGGTGQNGVTTGDLLYGSGTNTWSRLGIGTDGQVLQLQSSTIAWGSLDGGTF